MNNVNVLHLIPLIFGVITVLGLLLAYKQILRMVGVVVVPDDAIGIVNKRFVVTGKFKRLPDGAIVAMNGEAGLQADPLAPGLHYGYWPWQYEVTFEKFTTIPYGQIGIIESRDGKPLANGRVLSDNVDCDMFQNARRFLEGGGQRGPQATVVPPGTYRINTQLFKITLGKALDIPDDKVGVVTTKEGKALNTKSGDIAGPQVEGHNAFQDPHSFIANGGFKGLQEQVLLAGRYFINPVFAEVELVPLTIVPIANVGVVVSYVGEQGKDVTGDTFKHGNLVSRGEKGVWVDVLEPGKYPINPYTHKVELVPTANVVLNWANAKTEAHNLDKDLCTITARSGDGFTFNLDVSQIIHIPHSDAPKVIARFGTVQAMVTQVLEPIIGNYFRNAAQSSDVIDFLKNRQTRQADARQTIHDALASYNVEAVDTLIGDITPPAELMKTLTDRKLAEQEKVTYKTQQEAQEVRQTLAQSQAMADTQPQVVQSERSVQIAEFNAQATVKTAEGAATAVKINAEAEATRLTLVGNAEATKTLAIGNAEAEVIKNKINSMESNNYASIEVAKALGTSGQKLVPDISMGGGNGNGSIGEVLMATMLKQSMDESKNHAK